MTISINLLPDELRRRSIRMSVIRIWTPLVLITSIAIASLNYYRWQKNASLAARVAAMQPAAELAAAHITTVAEIESRLKALTADIASLQTAQPAEDPLKFLQIVSRCTHEIGDQLVVSRLDAERTTAPPPEVTLTGASGSKKSDVLPQASLRNSQIQISGHAVSDLAVTRFMSSLRESAGFHSVVLKSSQPSTAGGNETLPREFLIECLRREVQR